MLDKYIAYLLNDLRVCASQALEQLVVYRVGDQGFNESVPVLSLSNYFDMQPDALPPADQMSRIQTRAIVQHLMFLLHAINVYPQFPSGFPYSKRYTLLRQLWSMPLLLRFDEKQPIDFCTMDTSACPYGSEFCYCANSRYGAEDF